MPIYGNDDYEWLDNSLADIPASLKRKYDEFSIKQEALESTKLLVKGNYTDNEILNSLMDDYDMSVSEADSIIKSAKRSFTVYTEDDRPAFTASNSIVQQEEDRLTVYSGVYFIHPVTAQQKELNMLLCDPRVAKSILVIEKGEYEDYYLSSLEGYAALGDLRSRYSYLVKKVSAIYDISSEDLIYDQSSTASRIADFSDEAGGINI